MRRETPLPLKWIAQPLRMGTWKSARTRLDKWREPVVNAGKAGANGTLHRPVTVLIDLPTFTFTPYCDSAINLASSCCSNAPFMPRIFIPRHLRVSCRRRTVCPSDLELQPKRVRTMVRCAHPDARQLSLAKTTEVTGPVCALVSRISRSDHGFSFNCTCQTRMVPSLVPPATM